jgi:hypothetical protein
MSRLLKLHDVRMYKACQRQFFAKRIFRIFMQTAVIPCCFTLFYLKPMAPNHSCSFWHCWQDQHGWDTIQQIAKVPLLLDLLLPCAQPQVYLSPPSCAPSCFKTPSILYHLSIVVDIPWLKTNKKPDLSDWHLQEQAKMAFLTGWQRPAGSDVVTYSSLPGDTQLVGGWCQRLSSILFRGVFNL